MIILFSCHNNDKTNDYDPSIAPVPVPSKNITATVISEQPHDTSLFTEGFFIHNGLQYESTGSPEEMPNTRSLFGIRDTFTGGLKNPIEIDGKKYFGEGITIIKNRLYQLTYKNQVGFIYDAKTFARLDSFHYKNVEGWGLTTDSVNLVMTDGSDKITFLDPTSFKVVKTLSVTNDNQPVENLNEPEYVGDFIYANIFTTDTIVKIDIKTGKVVNTYNLQELHAQALQKNPKSLEMNGIAYNPTNKHFYVTGKMWPYIFEVSF